MQLFVDLDVQRDLCEPDGDAFVPGAPTALYRALTGRAEVRGIPIVGTVATHAHDSFRFTGSMRVGPRGERGSMPRHCVKGTLGWLKVRGTLLPASRFLAPGEPADLAELAAALASGETQAVYLEKEASGLFANPAAEPLLQALALAVGAPPACVVYGVGLETTVLTTVLSLRAAGLECTVLEDACTAASQESAARAVAELERAGATMASARELVEPG